MYINAFVQKTLHHATHKSLKHFISSFEESFASHPDIDAMDLARMARTIGTVEKRLGLSTKDLITTFTLCPACSKRYSPAYIAASNNATCTMDGCDGVLYSDKVLASGERKRTSTRTFPYASPINWIRRMLARDGIARLVQAWRKPEDENFGPPVTAEDWNHGVNRDEPLGDIMDGWGWRSRPAGVQRVVDPVTGRVTDQTVLNPPMRFSSLPFGLSLSMNVDWYFNRFQSNKQGNYSVGACFIIINNLPRHLRFLRENMCLALVMPGPNEPNGYALDQMMEPLVDDILQLQQGVRMPVWNNEQQAFEQLVIHGDLHNQIADLIARIKMIGAAGVASELNFCLYCRTRLSALSVPVGFTRANFPYRVPEEELDNRYYYKSLDNAEDREIFFQFTGTRFTELDRLGGWDAARRSPPDAMHLIFLGAVNYVAKQVLFAPGMLDKRPDGVGQPMDRYNDCLSRFWFPYNFGRLPPKTSARVKAEQWKVLILILPMLTFEAWRAGDTIPPDHVPRGKASSTSAKHQVRRAKQLHRRRLQHYTHTGHPEQVPEVADCFSSRDPRRHFRQIMRAAVIFVGIFVHSLSPNQASFLHELTEAFCVEYVRMNVHLPPNFHQLLHLEEFILENASLYNTHTWPFERANHDITQINLNGHGNGVLEGTMMKGWWTSSQIQGIVQRLQAIPDRTPADNVAIQNLISGLKGGVESKRQRGDLMAFLARAEAAYGRIQGIQDLTSLSGQSRAINIQQLGIYNTVLDFCRQMWPAHRFYGPGVVIPGGIYVPPEGAVRKHAYVEYDSLRYGSCWHSGGRRACYGYITNQQPVRVEQVLSIEIPNNPRLRTICVLVRLFRRPEIQPNFPWSAWQDHLGIAHWKFNTLAPSTSMPVANFAGVFALIDHQMSYGHYWVTVALKGLQEDFEDAQDGLADDHDDWH
ncbi:hypothetical protein BDV93DRAFT_481245 [Ceratobasidium sp. AG-I]|nr:hypothetical protein BDV93DRAFT_481245 [Ceratobasidium sp. AG-I]